MRLARRGGENVLHVAPELSGTPPRPGDPWRNYGGDWLWPVAQGRWGTLADSDWPPPTVLADLPWTAEAWENADGSQSCLLTRK